MFSPKRSLKYRKKLKVRQSCPYDGAVEVYMVLKCRGYHIFYTMGPQVEVRWSVFLYPQEDSWYLFLVETELNSAPQCGRKDQSTGESRD
jgi:hypothetical protein